MKALVYLVVALWMTSCGVNQNSSTSDLDSVADLSALWSNPSSIPVCFVDQNPSWQQYRDSIRDEVTASYNKTNKIRFTGWGFCNSTSSVPTIRIKIDNAISYNGGYILGCSHIGPGPSSYAACQGDLYRLAGKSYSGIGFNMFLYPLSKGTPTHEFGHALGLRHEHARTDVTDGCSTGEVAYEAGNIAYLTNYDGNSVMSYCSNAETLSSDDIQGLNTLYR